MPDNRHNPWYYLIPITAGVIAGSIIAWLLGYSPVVGGAAGAAALVVAFLVLGGPSKPTSAYGFGALALFCLPSWYWLVLALVLFAVVVAVLYHTCRLCWLFATRPRC